MKCFHLLALGVVFSACQVTPPAQLCSATNSFGVTHADSPAKAEALSKLVDAIGPAVQATLPDCTRTPVEIHLVPALESTSWGGVTMHYGGRDWIELPDREFDAHFRATLAHELVHYWLGPSWRTLPGKVEEGLANYIGARVESAYWPAEAGFAFLQLTTVMNGGFTVAWGEIGSARTTEDLLQRTKLRLSAPFDPESLPAVPGLVSGESPIHDYESERSNRPVYDAVGFLVVSRAGVDTVHALCRRAAMEHRTEVPASWLLEAARLDDHDLKKWRPALDELLTPESRAWLIERAEEQLAGRSGPIVGAPAAK